MKGRVILVAQRNTNCRDEQRGRTSAAFQRGRHGGSYRAAALRRDLLKAAGLLSRSCRERISGLAKPRND